METMPVCAFYSDHDRDRDRTPVPDRDHDRVPDPDHDRDRDPNCDQANPVRKIAAFISGSSAMRLSGPHQSPHPVLQ